MIPLGKLLIVFGGIMVLLGIVVVLSGRAGLPLGRLPGDFVYRGRNTTFYFPIVTCIVLSVALSFILWVVGRLSR
jgi:hypothetical protein